MDTLKQSARRAPRSRHRISPPLYWSSAPAWLGGLIVAAVDRLLLWHEVARQRHALRKLDDRMLRDIGVSQADVERECLRPFWDVGTPPSTW